MTTESRWLHVDNLFRCPDRFARKTYIEELERAEGEEEARIVKGLFLYRWETERESNKQEKSDGK